MGKVQGLEVEPEFATGLAVKGGEGGCAGDSRRIVRALAIGHEHKPLVRMCAQVPNLFVHFERRHHVPQPTVASVGDGRQTREQESGRITQGRKQRRPCRDIAHLRNRKLQPPFGQHAVRPRRTHGTRQPARGKLP